MPQSMHRDAWTFVSSSLSACTNSRQCFTRSATGAYLRSARLNSRKPVTLPITIPYPRHRLCSPHALSAAPVLCPRAPCPGHHFMERRNSSSLVRLETDLDPLEAVLVGCLRL